MLSRLSFLTWFLLLTTNARAEEVPRQYTRDQRLVIAAFQLDVARVKSLLQEGANPDARLGFYNGELFQDRWSLGYSPYGSDKWTPLLAVAHSHREPQPAKITENTSESRDRAEKIRKQIDPRLIQERDKRRVAIAQLLIDQRAKLDLDDGYGSTALDTSIYLGHDSLSLTLLKAGADPNSKTGVYIDGTDGITPLHRATKSPPVLKAMIKRGASLNVKDGEGETPLHWAAREPNAESVKLLIEAGANVNVRDKRGLTAMPGLVDPELYELLDETEKREALEKKKIRKLFLAAGVKERKEKDKTREGDD